MNTNALCRAIVAELLTTGLSQKALAKALGLSDTWFNRWRHEVDGRVLPVSAVDALVVWLRRQEHLVAHSLHRLEHAHHPDDQAASEPTKRAR